MGKEEKDLVLCVLSGGGQSEKTSSERVLFFPCKPRSVSNLYTFTMVPAGGGPHKGDSVLNM